MNDLERFFYNEPHRICQKWEHYFNVYETFFAKFRGRPNFRMLEIGVSQGGSLQMWRSYFGLGAHIIGVDINEACKRFEEPQTTIRIGSQSDPVFLKQLVDEFGCFDIILDDGGHTMEQQITSFDCLYPSVNDNGVYLVEDCHTSYHEPFQGGFRRPSTFIEFAKGKLDELNGFHVHESGTSLYTDFSRSTHAVTFIDSMVVFQKAKVPPPRYVERGSP